MRPSAVRRSLRARRAGSAPPHRAGRAGPCPPTGGEARRVGPRPTSAALPAGRAAAEFDEPVILLASVGAVRLSRKHVGPRLGNLFGPAARTQAVDDLLSRCDIRLRLGDLRL